MKSKIAQSSMEALLKKAGATRTSENAKTELKKLLKLEITRISEKSMLFAKHAKRKTVKKKDIKISITS